MKTISSIWVILDKHDNFCAFGSKVAWVSSGAAKNAFSLHKRYWDCDTSYSISPKIEDCPEYQLVKINMEIK